MRVLLATWPTSSHYFSMVGPGWALRSAGHDVRTISTPGVEGAVMRSGLSLSITGPRLDLASVWQGFQKRPSEGVSKAEHERLRSARAFSMFAMGAREMLDDVLAFALDWRPDIILYEPRMYAALKAARVLGVPAVRTLGGTDYTFTRRDAEREAMDELFESIGLAGESPFGDLTLDPCPPSLQVPDDGTISRQSMRYVPYNGPAVVPSWLSARPERPRVFISLGTMVATIMGSMNFVLDIIHSVAALDVEVLAGVFSDQRELMGELPENVRLVEDMPLYLMLPTCDAVVHHGGAGTMLTTVTSGVPQLILASGGDTVLCAERITATGAGSSVRGWTTTPQEIRAEVSQLLEDTSFREAAGRLAKENDCQPAPSELVSRLESLALTGVPDSVPAGR